MKTAASPIQPGDVFGELTVLAPAGIQLNGSNTWICKCSCGAICKVSARALRNGGRRSCGHLKRTDKAGVRSGRLVAVRQMAKRENGFVVWLCRCDCGNVALLLSSNVGSTKSCGCLQRGRGKPVRARCPACGDLFEISLDGNPTPQFCPSCAPKYRGQTWRVCPICKTLFPAPPSDKTVTCSKECSAQWRRLTHAGVSNHWSDEARAKCSQRGQTDNLKLGSPAAQRSPAAGRFETNQEAKVWTLIDPSGNEIVVRNLRMWARDHTDLFGKPPGDHSANQISAGFAQIVQTMLGKRKTPAMSYFGWTLKCLPQVPEQPPPSLPPSKRRSKG